MRRVEKRKANLNMTTMDRWMEYYKELLNEDRTDFQKDDGWIYEETNKLKLKSQ